MILIDWNATSSKKQSPILKDQRQIHQRNELSGLLGRFVQSTLRGDPLFEILIDNLHLLPFSGEEVARVIRIQFTTEDLTITEYSKPKPFHFSLRAECPSLVPRLPSSRHFS